MHDVSLSSPSKTGRFDRRGGRGTIEGPCKIFKEEGGSRGRPVEGRRSKNCSTSNASYRPKRFWSQSYY